MKNETPTPGEIEKINQRADFDDKRLCAVERQLFANPGREGQYQRTGHAPHPDPKIGTLAPENPRTVLERLDAIEARLSALEDRLNANGRRVGP